MEAIERINTQRTVKQLINKYADEKKYKDLAANEDAVKSSAQLQQLLNMQPGKILICLKDET